MNKRPASEFSVGDSLLLSFVRRVNLDMFWSKEPSTVGGTLSSYRWCRRNCIAVGIEPMVVQQGPYPTRDDYGMKAAISILYQSQRQGRNSKSYSQYDSIRKLRSCLAVGYNSSPYGIITDGSEAESIQITNRGVRFTSNKSPTESLLMRCFMTGLRKRMGRLVNQNMAISVDLLKEILQYYDQELEDSDLDPGRVRTIIICASAFVILFGGALRGNEVLYLERSELVKRRKDGRSDDSELDHVVVPLMGRFKGESGSRNFMMVLSSVTNSGIEIGRWVDLLSALLEMEGKGVNTGPGLCHEDGSLFNAACLNAELHDVLLEIQHVRSDLIPQGMDVKGKYSVNRSFRRGATTRAREVGVSEGTIAINNRWRQIERNGGSIPNLPMMELYTEISQTLLSQLRFSKSL